MFLRKKPSTFSTSNSLRRQQFRPHSDEISESVYLSTAASASIRVKKRHKSMGSEDCSKSWHHNSLSQHLSPVVNMNKSARLTSLGRMLTFQMASSTVLNETQLGYFILNNFASNLFDPRDYEETVEYFREPIKLFDYSRILNNIFVSFKRFRSEDNFNVF